MKRSGIQFLALALAALILGGIVLQVSGGQPDGEGSPEVEEEALLQIRSETGRETVSLYAKDWKLLCRLRLDKDGTGSLPRPEAGEYHLIRGDGSTMAFSLDEAGNVTVGRGTGWGNGTVLELTEEQRGSIRVLCHAEKNAVCRLSGGGAEQEAEMEPGEDGAVECRFGGLKPGIYQVFVEEEWVVTVTVRESALDRVVELY